MYRTYMYRQCPIRHRTRSYVLWYEHTLIHTMNYYPNLFCLASRLKYFKSVSGGIPHKTFQNHIMPSTPNTRSYDFFFESVITTFYRF
jgi:hypothetical protein